MAITRTRLKPPFNKVVVVTLLLVSLAALLLLLLVPEQWPVLVSVHLVCVGLFIVSYPPSELWLVWPGSEILPVSQ